MKRMKYVKIITALVTVIISIFLFDTYPKVILPMWDKMVKPKEGEIETISEILAVEDEILKNCENKIAEYDEEIQKLGIEIRVELHQLRGLYGARVEPYDLREKQKLPGAYSSRIECRAYKNGELLSKQAEYDKRVTMLYTMIYPIMFTNGKETWYYENVLDDFDIQMKGLIRDIQKDFGF